MVDHQRQLIFVHIARTGGTSIETALIGRDWWEVDPQSKHLSASQSHRLYGDELWNRYFKFSIVRNPWDRLVSMWATGWWETESASGERRSFPEWLRGLRPHPHEIYQSLHYHQILDEPIDRVLRFEHLAADFERLLTDAGCPVLQLPHCEQRPRESYQRYYDAETRDYVGQVYAEDIRRFGYEF